MSRALVQSTLCHAAVVGENSGRLRASSGKNKMSVKMVSANGSIRGFTGLRCSNTLDLISRSRRDFQSTVAASISVSGGKATSGVIVAMFERFTDKAIKVVSVAQEEARRLGHNQVGTEQLLLGLIGETTGIAAKVLKSMGIHLKNARVEVEKIVGRGSGFVGSEIPFTARAKRVFELSLEEARHLGNFFYTFRLAEICWSTCI